MVKVRTGRKREVKPFYVAVALIGESLNRVPRRLSEEWCPPTRRS